MESLSGKDLEKAILEALADPDRFTFGDILAMPNVEAYAKNNQALVDLVKIFAHGTVAEYNAKKGSLPTLNEAQSSKLKKLTLLSLASQSKTLPYDGLVKKLEAKNAWGVEDLITDCIRKGLLKGKHNPKAKEFVVEYAECRDISDSDLDGMASQIAAWLESSGEALKILERKIIETKDAHKAEELRENGMKEEMARVKKVLEAKASNHSAHGRHGKRGGREDGYDSIRL